MTLLSVLGRFAACFAFIVVAFLFFEARVGPQGGYVLGLILFVGALPTLVWTAVVLVPCESQLLKRGRGAHFLYVAPAISVFMPFATWLILGLYWHPGTPVRALAKATSTLEPGNILMVFSTFWAILWAISGWMTDRLTCRRLPAGKAASVN